MEQVSLEDRWPILEVTPDAIVSKKGDVTIALELHKPEIFTLGVAEYERLHEHFVKALKLLPAGTVVHLQDTYRKHRWRRPFPQPPPTKTGISAMPEDQSWLSAASDRFFDGRSFLRHESRLYLTRVPEGRPAVNSASSGLLQRRLVPAETLDDRLQREFEDVVRQFSRVLTDSGLVRVRRIAGEELMSAPGRPGIIEQYAWLQDEGTPVIRDIDFHDRLAVGERHAVMYSLADAEQLPDGCASCVDYGPYSAEHSKLWIGFAARLGLLLDCDHIVNQYIVIADQARTMARLEKKRLRLQSLSRYSRSNTVALDFVNAFLNEAVTEQRTLCRAHVHVLAWVEDKGELRELRSKLAAAFSALGAVAREETVGLAQLWFSGIPGNAGDLPENECFDTFLEQAVCFLGMETNYRDLGKEYGIRLGDRLTGRPMRLDMEIARRLGWTGNSNMVVLSGSGGGKSYCMAHLCRTWLEQQAHIVLVDVGRSYETLCRLVGGVYKTYEEDKPISFNPFWVPPGQTPDLEKKESIKSLLMALLKRSDEEHYRSEYVTISDAVACYYSMLGQRPEVFPCFDSFYSFMEGGYCPMLRARGIKQHVFDSENFLHVLRPYASGGEFDFLLNARKDLDLLTQPFIVFELRNIVDHPILMTVVTMVIVEVFMVKVRMLRGVVKKIVIEEAWKPIASAGMAGEIKGWGKTLRKHMGALALVSQELDDIIGSPIIRDTIINNSDIKILLDQSKFARRFDEIQATLGISDKQKAEILSINRGHDPGGRPYKDLWIGLGADYSRVFRLETSEEEYLAYTSDEGDKVKIGESARRHGGLREGIERLAEQMRAKQGKGA